MQSRQAPYRPLVVQMVQEQERLLFLTCQQVPSLSNNRSAAGKVLETLVTLKELCDGSFPEITAATFGGTNERTYVKGFHVTKTRQ